MNKRELAKEYNIKSNYVYELYKDYREKYEGLVCYHNLGKYGKAPVVGIQSGYCIVNAYDIPYITGPDDVAPTYFDIKKCSHFNDGKGCDCEICPSYTKYMEYRTAYEKYQIASQELYKYPFLVRFIAFFQREQ